MAAIITALLPVLLQVLENTPAIVSEVESVWGLLTSTTSATAEQQIAVQAALDAAHAQLQAS